MTVNVKDLILGLVSEADGQDLIEYALLATLIAILGIAGAETLGPKIATKWGSVSALLG